MTTATECVAQSLSAELGRIHHQTDRITYDLDRAALDAGTALNIGDLKAYHEACARWHHAITIKSSLINRGFHIKHTIEQLGNYDSTGKNIRSHQGPSVARA